MNEFLTQYWGELILGCMFLLFLFRRNIKKLFQRRQRQPANEPMIEAEDLYHSVFNTNYNILSTLKEQKKQAETEIRTLMSEGKKIVSELKTLDSYYTQNKVGLTSKRQMLGQRFTTWKDHLAKVDSMITNQERLEVDTRQK